MITPFQSGFGRAEREAEFCIMRDCHEAIKNIIPSSPEDGDHHDERKRILREMELQRNAECDSYKQDNEPPSRYSYFWCYYCRDYDNYFVSFSFLHINRRHPLSPDGWAAIRTKGMLMVDSDGPHYFFEDIAMAEEGIC